VEGIPKGIPGAGKAAVDIPLSGEKAVRVLGIKYKTMSECAKDTVEAIRSRGW